VPAAPDTPPAPPLPTHQTPADPPVSDPHLWLLPKSVLVIGHQIEESHRRGRPQATKLQLLQQQVREHVIDWVQRFQQAGLTRVDCAALLHIAPSTLRYWGLEHCRRMLGLAPVGRPLSRAPLPVRQQILADLKLLGPGVGLPTLQQHFPTVPRAELADLLGRFRAVRLHRDRTMAHVLHWQTPGRVWAADFTQPSYDGGNVLAPLAGVYPYVLAVRDLASGMMLAWEPLPDLTEPVTQQALALLFALHGAPLILKVDNGSAFRADAFQDFLDASEVIPLYSPPACPGYHGSIEAAIGSLKTRTQQQARAQGHGERWEQADLAAAQAAANTSHPRRFNGRTPSAVWQTRTSIAVLERTIFALTVDTQRFQVRDELGIDQDEPLDHWRQSAVDRRALQRALVEHGHLLFTGRRIPLKIRRHKVTADG
jgi:transposase InsO family protein